MSLTLDVSGNQIHFCIMVTFEVEIVIFMPLCLLNGWWEWKRSNFVHLFYKNMEIFTNGLYHSWQRGVCWPWGHGLKPTTRGETFGLNSKSGRARLFENFLFLKQATFFLALKDVSATHVCLLWWWVDGWYVLVWNCFTALYFYFLKTMEWGSWKLCLQFSSQLWAYHLLGCLLMLSQVERSLY